MIATTTRKTTFPDLVRAGELDGDWHAGYPHQLDAAARVNREVIHEARCRFCGDRMQPLFYHRWRAGVLEFKAFASCDNARCASCEVV